jgi:hypothetical protein
MRGRLALVCIVGALTFPAAAAANHRHALTTGSGDCVVLAGAQGMEPAVTLPDASFNNTIEPVTTANPHPLHVHVHRGEPGTNLDIVVLGSPADDCEGYVNYAP